MFKEMGEDRLKVQTKLGVNMVVEAGAGTGKTTLLITRICLAVLAQGTRIEKIVALTFTDKAAAEIKNRLVNTLHQVVREINLPTDQRPEKGTLLSLLRQEFSLEDAVILDRAQKALMQLDRASVGTIHSFCADILKTFPLEAGLSPHAEIDSGAKAARLFDSYWNSFLDEELGRYASRAQAWKEVLTEISLEELKAFAQELCSGKIEQYDYFSHAALLANICEEKSRQAQVWSTAFLDPKKPSPRSIEKALSWAEKSLQRSAAFLRRESLPQDVPLPPALPSAALKGWEEDTFEAARSLVQFALKMQPQKQEIFQKAFELVDPVSRQIRAAYEQEGILSFDDLIVKTRNLVRRDLYVRRMLKEKLDVLFIDEFQDTDPVQGELLLFLAEKKTGSAARWQDVQLEPGKLFVVGDPKQSIYRFRGADITAYELFTQLILSQGGEKCFLRRNFRSTPDIVATANLICRRAMIQQTAFQPAYEPIFPVKETTQKSVSWLFVNTPAENPSADELRANQAERIAQWICQNVGKLTLANGEKLAYRDIAILSRAATTSGPYTEALRRHGIAFNSEGEKDFFRRQEIHDLLNFLRVVDNPSDTTSLVGVLRSPLGGYTDEEVYQITVRQELSVFAKTADKSLARLYALLLSFINKSGRTDVARLVQEVLDNTFLPEVCAGAYDGEQTWDILTRLVRQIDTWAGGRPISLGQFIAAVQQQIEQTPEQLNAFYTESLDAVSVMTVHKSKGLDFPVVILADLSRKEAAGSSLPPHLFSWQYNMHGLRAGKICDANLAFLEEEQKKHERCEEIRILYVALTRAKEHLILVADGRKGAEKAAAPFVAAGLFPHEKVPCLGREEVQVAVSYFDYIPPEQFLYRPVVTATPGQAPQELVQWRKTYEQRRARYHTLLAQTSLSPSQLVQENRPFSVSQQSGAVLGTVCHRALQLIAKNPSTPLAEAVREAAGTTGLLSCEQEALELLEPFVRSDVFAEIKKCRLLASEMPFSFVNEAGLVSSGVMDAVLQQADGTVWVLDYKTDHIPAEGLTSLLEKYRPQLTVYAKAARKLFTVRPVRCSAVFVRAFAACDL